MFPPEEAYDIILGLSYADQIIMFRGLERVETTSIWQYQVLTLEIFARKTNWQNLDNSNARNQ